MSAAFSAFLGHILKFVWKGGFVWFTRGSKLLIRDIWASYAETNHCRRHVNLAFQYLGTTDEQDRRWRAAEDVVRLLYILLTLCVFVCVSGFQGAGNSSHCHHIPCRFLLLFQLCEDWHCGDAGAWLFWLPSWGKTSHLNFNLRMLNWMIYGEFTQCVSFLEYIWGRTIETENFTNLIVCFGAKGRRKYIIWIHWKLNEFLTCQRLHKGNLTWIQPLCRLFIAEAFLSWHPNSVWRELSCAQKSIMVYGKNKNTLCDYKIILTYRSIVLCFMTWFSWVSHFTDSIWKSRSSASSQSWGNM